MAEVQTVQGAVDAQELGLVLVHEHVRFRDEAVAEQWPGRYDEQLELDAALVAVTRPRQRGVQTIVDPTAMFGGRDVRFMKRVAERRACGSSPCTGIYSYDYLPHYFENRDIDVMADHFVEDIERGVQGTDDQGGLPEVRRRCRRGDRERREDPPRGGARERADRRADHGALDAGGRHRPAPGGDLRGGGRRPRARADRALRRHRGPRLHRGPDRARRLRRAWTATAWRCTCRSTGATRPRPSCCGAGHAERLMISQDFCATIDWFPAGGRRGVRGQRGDPQLVDDAGLRRGRSRAARAWA